MSRRRRVSRKVTPITVIFHLRTQGEPQTHERHLKSSQHRQGGVGLASGQRGRLESKACLHIRTRDDERVDERAVAVFPVQMALRT